MSIYQNMEDGLKQKIYWGIVALFACVAIFTFWSSYQYDKELKSQSVTVEKVTGEYSLLGSSGPSPLLITVKDNTTGITYTDSFVSSSCPQYDSKSKTVTKLTLTRFTNMKLADNAKEYVFKGAYEQLCTNLKYDPKSGDNFLNTNN